MLIEDLKEDLRAGSVFNPFFVLPALLERSDKADLNELIKLNLIADESIFLFMECLAAIISDCAAEQRSGGDEMGQLCNLNSFSELSFSILEYLEVTKNAVQKQLTQKTNNGGAA